MTNSRPDGNNAVNNDGADTAGGNTANDAINNDDACRGGRPRPLASDNNADGPKMSIIGHIEELRRTLIRCICAVIICAIPCGIYWTRIFEWIAIYPLRLSDPSPRIIYTAPAETVMLSFKIALTCGIVIASPVIFQQIWSFVSPGLYKKEKLVILPAAIASTFCFLLGITFCYFMLPMLLQFLTAFASGQIAPFYRIDEYLSFLINLSLAFGLAFELPVVVFVLSKMRVINHRFMIKYFRHAIVLIFILAAVITPPDVLSQILLATPLVGLYAVSILISYLANPAARGGVEQ
ncbi:MAG: twin-arginine translocase subunit TatC [Chitinispirillia bacterium]|nr:twin-arginine translocase subunit TatC [Chitinispirillia bacterium]MCL2241812.1 twin-arginine translocase subunit TatC [Chitinispirillia bacterium]